MYRNAKAELVKQGLTLNDLAEKLNSYPSIWSEKLNGKRAITFTEAVMFKQAIKSTLSLEELFKVFEEAE